MTSVSLENEIVWTNYRFLKACVPKISVWILSIFTLIQFQTESCKSLSSQFYTVVFFFWAGQLFSELGLPSKQLPSDVRCLWHTATARHSAQRLLHLARAWSVCVKVKLFCSWRCSISTRLHPELVGEEQMHFADVLRHTDSGKFLINGWKCCESLYLILPGNVLSRYFSFPFVLFPLQQPQPCLCACQNVSPKGRVSRVGRQQLGECRA